jgi:poly(3-hydroxybutyrate) depolymerase
MTGQRVDLTRIHRPLNLLRGAMDHVTPADQVFALAGAASTPDTAVTRVHRAAAIRGFMGREALSQHWPALLAQVARRSSVTR